MIPATERFSNRVEDYILYRPHYPSVVVECLRSQCRLTETMVIADIGSGTGILTEMFLRNGNAVYGIEPNPQMRAAGERLLQAYPRFKSIAATAEATTLPPARVDMVTAGQTFHWFDPDKAKAEFKHILKPEGWVVLVWNERQADATPLAQAYEQLLHTYAADYSQVHHKQVDNTVLQQFFGGEFHCNTFPNSQYLVTNSATLASAEIATTRPAEAAFTVASVPSLTVTKTASANPAIVGQVITYTYRVTNSGNGMLTDIAAVDDQLGSVSLGTTTLEPKQGTSGIFTYTIAEADLPGPLSNTVTVTGSSVGGDVGATASESVTLTYKAGLTVTQKASAATGAVGETITYTYHISNTDNVSLTDLTAAHTQIGNVSLELTTLAPGQETTGILTYILTEADLPGPLMSTITVTGALFDNSKINAAATTSVMPSEENDENMLYLPLIKKES